MAETLAITFTPEEEGKRLDAALAGRIELGLSRSRIRQLIDEGLVTIAGRRTKPAQKVTAGEVAEMMLPAPEPMAAVAEEMPLDIVYEDNDLIVVNKQRGLVVHPAPGHRRGTLVNALLAHCPDLEEINSVIRPGIVHRLDKDTTGLLVVAKNARAYRSLVDQMRRRAIHRGYLTLVWGRPEAEAGKVISPIGRHPVDRKRMAVVESGRPAVTHFVVREELPNHSLLEVTLETGRTHQIRVHLAYIGHPVVADPVYGGRRNGFGLAGQALHAATLELTHPVSGRPLRFEAPLPADFTSVLERLRVDTGTGL